MKKLLSFLLAVTLCLALYGCQKKPEKYTDYSFDCFDTVTTIIGFEDSKEEFDEVCSFIKEELYEYHKLYTIYTSYEGVNNLYRVNKEHKALTVDKKIIDMLSFSKEMYELTGGKTNIALGSVLSIWHNYRTRGLNDPANATLPSANALSEAAEHTDIKNIIIDSENSTVYLNDDKMTLDVGAVAKGYAVQRVAETLEEKGVYGYLLNVGGNIKVVGKRPDGQAWKIGIENPDRQSSQAYVEQLSLDNYSVVTSGSYQRFYTVDGEDYHHIIDNNTNMPANYFKSVSVICENSGKADALSTALFCMTLEQGKSLVEALPETEAMWVGLDGVQHYSSGFKNYCK